MKDYPVNLNIKNKNSLVVGGGRVSCRKIERLLKCNSRVKVVSPSLNDETKTLINNKKCKYIAREFKKEDLAGMFLVIAATDSRKINREIAYLARKEGILVNVVDDYGLSDFTLPAVLDRGELLITFFTGGNLPALSKKLRRELEREYGMEYDNFLRYIKEIRPKIIDQIDDQKKRRKIFQQFADKELIKLFGTNISAAILKIKKIITQISNDNIDLP